MRSSQLMAIVGALLVGTAAGALDLGATCPLKSAVTYPANPPSEVRQGGDTIADAVAVSIPVLTSGTTVGFTDDYDEACPYSLSTSPDVVYSLSAGGDMEIDIDLLGSTYDTKVYVYDQDLVLVACNDDFYPDYVSKLEGVPLEANVQYFVVIDGYGGAAGDYLLQIYQTPFCVIECPAGGELEGEPPLVDGYLDVYNSGCGSPDPGSAFGTITHEVFCGVSGWYLASDGLSSRDTDWFEIEVPASGAIEIEGDAERPTYVCELAPHDCGSVAIVQSVVIGPCVPQGLVIPGAPGSTVWLWVGPTSFVGPINEYSYVLLTNLASVAVEARSWSAMKGLFD
ncbi:MAG: hypothetical protein R3D98_04550 [Candidatus Krumholzibacteriia bacterium]